MLRTWALRTVLFSLCALSFSAWSSPAQIVFEFVCVEPADCDGDSDFQFHITLDHRVVKPNGVYSTGSDDGRGFLQFYARSSAGNNFSIGKGYDYVKSNHKYVAFVFDQRGNISAMYATDSRSNQRAAPVEDSLIEFNVAGAGKITWRGLDTVSERSDNMTPPGFFPVEETPIRGEWRRLRAAE